MADAAEAIGQIMQKKPADERVRLQPHDLDNSVLTIILPCEGDMIVVASFDAAVGDGAAMGVAAEMGEDRRGSAERLVGVDDPRAAPHGRDMGGEGGFLGEMCKVAEEAEGTGVEGALQPFEEQAPEQHRQRFDGE